MLRLFSTSPTATRFLIEEFTPTNLTQPKNGRAKRDAEESPKNEKDSATLVKRKTVATAEESGGETPDPIARHESQDSVASNTEPASDGPSKPAAKNAAGAPNESTGKNPFASEQKLDEHYAKHVQRQREFGSISKDEYVERALRLRDTVADGRNVIEHPRPDGSKIRFDKSTGEFGAYNADGSIRTHFRPEKGWTYFLEQMK